MANRKARETGYKYGFGMADNGYTGEKENGASAVALDKFHGAFGWGADPTWQTRIGPDGQIQYKARSQNPDRVRVTGGDWFTAPAHVQRGFQNIQNFKNEHGQDRTYADFQMFNGLQHRVGKTGSQWHQGSDGIWVNAAAPYGTRYTAEGHAIDDNGVHGMGLGTTGAWMGGSSSYNPWGMNTGSPSPTSQTPTGGLPANPEGPGGIGGQMGQLPTNPTPQVQAPPSVPNMMPQSQPNTTGSWGQFAQPEGIGQFDPNDPMGAKKRKQRGTSSLSQLGGFGAI